MTRISELAGGGSVVEELLKTPFIKDILRDALSGIDPDSGSRFVRTALWQDPELLFSLAGALPAMLNVLIQAFSETPRQLSAFAPELVDTLAAKVIADLDTKTLQEGLRAWIGFAGGILKEHPELRDSGIVAEALGRGITAGAQRIIRIQQEQPHIIEQHLARVMARVDRKIVGQASALLLTAILNQRLALAAWGAKQALRRIGRRLRGKG